MKDLGSYQAGVSGLAKPDVLQLAAQTWHNFIHCSDLPAMPLEESKMVAIGVFLSGMDSVMRRLQVLLTDSLMGEKVFDKNRLCQRFRAIRRAGSASDSSIKFEEYEMFFVAGIAQSIVRKWSACVSAGENDAAAELEVSLVALPENPPERVFRYKEKDYVRWIVSVLNHRVELVRSIIQLKQSDRCFVLKSLATLRSEVSDAVDVVMSESINSTGENEECAHQLLHVYQSLVADFFKVSVAFDYSHEAYVIEFFLSEITQKEFAKRFGPIQKTIMKELLSIYRAHLGVGAEKKLAADLVKSWDSDVIAHIVLGNSEDFRILKLAIVGWCKSIIPEMSKVRSQKHGPKALAEIIGVPLENLVSTQGRILLTYSLLSAAESQSQAKSGNQQQRIAADIAAKRKLLCPLDEAFSVAIYKVFNRSRSEYLSHMQAAIQFYREGTKLNDVVFLHKISTFTALTKKFEQGKPSCNMKSLRWEYSKEKEGVTWDEVFENYPILIHSLWRVMCLVKFSMRGFNGSAESPKIMLLTAFRSPLDQPKQDYIEERFCIMQAKFLLSTGFHRTFFSRNKKSKSSRVELLRSMLDNACRFYKDLIPILFGMDEEQKRAVIIDYGLCHHDEVFMQIYSFLSILDFVFVSPMVDRSRFSLYANDYVPTLLFLLHHVSEFYEVDAMNNTLRSLGKHAYKCILSFLEEDKCHQGHHFLLNCLKGLDKESCSIIRGNIGDDLVFKVATAVIPSVYSPVWMETCASLLLFQVGVSSSLPEMLGIFSVFIQSYIEINHTVRGLYSAEFSRWVGVFVDLILNGLSDKASVSQSKAIFMSLITLYLGFKPESRLVFSDVFDCFFARPLFQSLEKSLFDSAQLNDILEVHSLGLEGIPCSLTIRKVKTEEQKIKARNKKRTARARKKLRKAKESEERLMMSVADRESCQFEKYRKELGLIALEVEAIERLGMKSADSESRECKEFRVELSDSRIITPCGFESKEAAPFQLSVYDLRKKRMVTHREGSSFLKDLTGVIDELSKSGVSIYLKCMDPGMPSSDLDWLLVSRDSVLKDRVLDILSRYNILAPHIKRSRPLNKFYYRDPDVGINDQEKIKIDVQLLCVRDEGSEREALHGYFRAESLCSVQISLLRKLIVLDGKLGVEDPLSVLPKGFSEKQYHDAWEVYWKTGRLHVYESYIDSMLPNKGYVDKLPLDYSREFPFDFKGKLYNLCYVFKIAFKFKQSLDFCSLFSSMFMSLYSHENKKVAKVAHQFWYDFLTVRAVAHKNSWVDQIGDLYVNSIGGRGDNKGSSSDLRKFFRLTLDIFRGKLERSPDFFHPEKCMGPGSLSRRELFPRILPYALSLGYTASRAGVFSSSKPPVLDLRRGAPFIRSRL